MQFTARGVGEGENAQLHILEQLQGQPLTLGQPCIEVRCACLLAVGVSLFFYQLDLP